jgi:SAM-dependent methyltransferase
MSIGSVHALTDRVCPLTERAGPTRPLAYAPAPWLLLKCEKTGFVFLANPPTYEALKEDYAWEVTSKLETTRRREAEPALHLLSAAGKAFRARVIRRNKICALARRFLREAPWPRLQLLDLGCGTGGLLPRIVGSLPAGLRSRCRPYGIELSRELAAVAHHRLVSAGGECFHDNALDGLARFPADHLQLVIMSAFLEHELNPLPLLRRCYTHLVPGGQIIMKVPNFGCLNRIVRGRRWCGFRWPDHVNYFTPATLRAMAARAGFQVARMRFVDRHPFSDNMYAVFEKPHVATSAASTAPAPLPPFD